jgi:hypothetical protein
VGSLVFTVKRPTERSGQSLIDLTEQVTAALWFPSADRSRRARQQIASAAAIAAWIALVALVFDV